MGNEKGEERKGVGCNAEYGVGFFSALADFSSFVINSHSVRRFFSPFLDKIILSYSMFLPFFYQNHTFVQYAKKQKQWKITAMRQELTPFTANNITVRKHSAPSRKAFKQLHSSFFVTCSLLIAHLTEGCTVC
jgi:hypothetical protein